MSFLPLFPSVSFPAFSASLPHSFILFLSVPARFPHQRALNPSRALSFYKLRLRLILRFCASVLSNPLSLARSLARSFPSLPPPPRLEGLVHEGVGAQVRVVVPVRVRHVVGLLLRAARAHALTHAHRSLHSHTHTHTSLGSCVVCTHTHTHTHTHSQLSSSGRCTRARARSYSSGDRGQSQPPAHGGYESSQFYSFSNSVYFITQRTIPTARPRTHTRPPPPHAHKARACRPERTTTVAG